MVADTESPEEELGPNLRLTTTMTIASTPATPGPSTPTVIRSLPLDQLKVDDDDEGGDIIPPARPSSTPYPHQELLDGHIQCLRRQNYSDPSRITASEHDRDHQGDLYSVQSSIPNFAPSNTSALCDLPIEIHECILDHLFGVRSSASTRTSSPGASKVLRGWGTALRHCRRREVSDLALVSEKWRGLIQDRLYRHIKIKGTRESVDQSMLWFLRHPQLCSYVRHIEIWFPVFQQKAATDRTLRVPSAANRPAFFVTQEESSTYPAYQSPNNNCTLEEVLRFIQLTFSEACILTLEGGERKKPPMVRQFVTTAPLQSLPVVETIRTLVCKGQWNLLRTNEDFQTIAAALPNLNEWHGAYAKPKSKSYLCMATILPNLPIHLTHLNLCLESDFRREAVSPSFVRKVGLKTHFCSEMGKAMPALEHFAYTGRVCHSFFDVAAGLSNIRTSRLKSVDLIVKNVCRPTFQWNDGSGITDMAFIIAFEALVISGVRALDKLAALGFLRIRFIDLDSQLPCLNPYFQLKNDKCTGIWSDKIIETLSRTRPSAAFVEKSDSFTDVTFLKDGQLLSPPTASKARPLSIKVSSYLSLSTGITIT